MTLALEVRALVTAGRSAITVVPQGLERAVAGVHHRPGARIFGLLRPPQVGEGVRHLAGEAPHAHKCSDHFCVVAPGERDVLLRVHE